jgi:hypothetical protein
MIRSARTGLTISPSISVFSNIAAPRLPNSKLIYGQARLVITSVPIDTARAMPTINPPTKWILDECEPYISSVEDGIIAAHAAQIAAARRRSGDSFLMPQI